MHGITSKSLHNSVIFNQYEIVMNAHILCHIKEWDLDEILGIFNKYNGWGEVASVPPSKLRTVIVVWLWLKS